MAQDSNLQRIAELIGEERHEIQFNVDGWIIAHPLCERLNGSLFNCAFKWVGNYPASGFGRYWVDEEGRLEWKERIDEF